MKMTRLICLVMLIGTVMTRIIHEYYNDDAETQKIKSVKILSYWWWLW